VQLTATESLRLIDFWTAPVDEPFSCLGSFGPFPRYNPSRPSQRKIPVMAKIRCPYCVDGEGFKIMTRHDTHLVCERCGHKVVPGLPAFECLCPKCQKLYRPTKIPAQW